MKIILNTAEVELAIANYVRRQILNGHSCKVEVLETLDEEGNYMDITDKDKGVVVTFEVGVEMLESAQAPAPVPSHY